MKFLLESLTSLDRQPRYLGKLIDNVCDYINWNTVEYCLNNPQFYPIEIIKNNNKLQIPKSSQPWHSTEIPDKKFIIDNINQGNSFIILNYSYNNMYTLELMKEISTRFDVYPDIHAYGGLSGSTSFVKHLDFPPNIIIQAEGETPWKIWKDPNDSPVVDVVLKPGEALYIPAGYYHVAEPKGKRISMSIPCWPRQHDNTANHTDRNFYKINYFEEEKL
jgi:hypothetical protein